MKRTPPGRAVTATLAMIALLLTACGSDGGGSGEPTPDANTTGSTETAAEEPEADQEVHQVRLATLAPSALLWLHAIAEDQDLYAEHGVEVEAVQVSDSPTLVQAVASGSAEAGVSLGDSVIRAVDEGAPIVMSGAILERTILRLVGAPGVSSPEELAGTRITAGAVQGGTSNLLLYQLQEFGISRDDVELVAIPNSRDRLVGMQNGEISGALLIAPFDVQAESEGMEILDVYEDYYVQTPLILNTQWASENEDAARGITQAFRAAAEWIYEEGNRDEAVRILSEYTGIDEETVEEAYEFMVVEQQAISRDLTVPEEGLANILKIDEAVQGTDHKELDVSTYYDSSFLDG